jgi:hypothetical protein
MSDVRLKILPPWTIVMRKFEALFDGDPQIACNCDFSGTHPTIVLACNNGDKVAALQQILPVEINFGNVELVVMVDGKPSNRAFTSKVDLFDTAFKGNPAYAYSICPAEEGYQWIGTTYVVFKNCVVQFAADNLNDCHGIISTLYQTIAEELLTGYATEGVFYNTDVERANLGMPLGEWP